MFTFYYAMFYLMIFQIKHENQLEVAGDSLGHIKVSKQLFLFAPNLEYEAPE